MVHKIPVHLLTLSLFLLFSACAQSGDEGSQQDAPAVVTIGEADAGNTFTLAVGGQLVVSLPANPSTGYTWEPQPAPDDIILQLSNEPQFIEQNTNKVGAPGVLTFTFDALGSGETTLTLVYHRAWETGVPPLETYEVTVVVE